ncbi:MAG: GNAT family N-acetyltransferase [Verrucomicrobia bacterium RIFCSPLOWO2_12_FULL_64_8]|nr:MAG: GNAT family N-acetyltransferase [Verrucomicrobia bacterium RIFCSPLOWO2_12_FULL_64_8]
MPQEIQLDGYVISDDPGRLDIAAIHAYLTRSYWAEGIPLEIVAQSVRNSLCLGLYGADGAQVGLARVVTDYSTFAWLCDVYVLEAHRGKGLGKALVRAVLDHPGLQNLRRFSLATRDAHGLYAGFGFTPLAKPASQMEKRSPRPSYLKSTPV